MNKDAFRDRRRWQRELNMPKEPLSSDAVLAEVMTKIKAQSLFVDSSTIEIDVDVLEEILSHNFS